jgi:hypothetical protein
MLADGGEDSVDVPGLVVVHSPILPCRLRAARRRGGPSTAGQGRARVAERLLVPALVRWPVPPLTRAKQPLLARCYLPSGTRAHGPYELGTRATPGVKLGTFLSAIGGQKRDGNTNTTFHKGRIQ